MKYILSLSLIMFILPKGLAQEDDPVYHLRFLLISDRENELLLITDTLETHDSLRASIYYYRGKAFQALLNYDSAYQSFCNALDYDSSNISYMTSAGQMLTVLGRVREAIEVYEDIVSRNVPTNQQLAELANLYSMRKDYPRSLGIYLDLIGRDSLNYFYNKQAGKCLLEMGLPDSSIHYYSRALELNPADVFVTHQLANIYLKKKEFEAGLQLINNGLNYDPANTDLLKLRGYIYLLSGDNRMAISDLEQARAEDTNSAFIHKYLGISYHEEKMYDRARRSLEMAFWLDSTDAETAFFLGNACRWSKYEEQGLWYFNKSIELMQPDPEELKNIYLQLAELYKVLHRFDEALDSYFKALELDYTDNVVYFKIGQTYDRNLDEKKNAIKYYEMYLTEGSTDQQLFNTSEGRSEALDEHVKERIRQLKEELFFDIELE